MSHKNNRGRIRGSRRLRSVVGGLLAIGAWALGVAVPAVADYEAGLRAWEKGDFASALVELRKSADAGDKRAQDHLGMMFEDGEGVPRSNQTAAYWYQQSAEQGHAQAQLNLGRMYRNGKGVPQDDKQAVAWYRRAAAQGLAVAQFFLGLMYDTGKGVDASASHAYMWFSLAAEQGDQDAAFKRDRVVDRLTASERDAADRAAAKYRKPNAAVVSSATSRAPETASGVAGAPTAPSTAVSPAPPASSASEPALSEAEIYRVQTYLNELGYDVGKPDGVPGERTRAAVIAFEKAMGRPATGDLSPELPELLLTEQRRRADADNSGTAAPLAIAVTVPSTTDEPELDTRSLVSAVQRELLRIGYDPGPVDGAMGSKTRNAIIEFQRSIDVSANGQATTELLDTLRATQIEVVAPSAPSSIGSAPSPRATAPDADSVSQEVIRAAEVALKERGFDPGPVDGVADAATIAAVKTFQEGVGMVPDGVITPALAQRLQGREIGAAAPAAAVTSSVAPRSDPTTAARGDANVFEAQQLLNQLGYDAGVPDGQVGSRTVSAVKAYQSQIGNPVTGNIGLGLLGNLRDSRSRGEVARPMMAAIQRDLTRLGYTPGPADGLGGPRTERAIRAFQRDAGLDVDGRATLDLATRLETLASQ